MSAHARSHYRQSPLCRSRRSRGGAVLETIIIMPLLLSLSFGAAEYSYFFYVKNALSGAARDGARAAIPSTGTNTSVTTAINTSLAAANIDSSSCTVTTSPTNVSTASAGSLITVTITATWGTIGIMPLSSTYGGISSTKQVVGTAVMIKE